VKKEIRSLIYVIYGRKKRKKQIIPTSFITCDKNKMYIWRKKKHL
jgi:hypothetical protein